ncbi:L,D-transpeptidase family protein [Vibrio panuliri]|nr:L,D-transpeptidase family protein [Vibrio panuliri]KAB1457654.1 L,D-transpeptidase family protein [Vibrio panuliri]
MKFLLSLLFVVLSASVYSETDISVPSAVSVNKVTVDKSKRRLYLMNNDQVVREFRIALGKRPVGHKVYEGDQRTPEGIYKLEFVMEDSQFYRSIHISYPNEQDVAFAQRLNLNPGGDIKIHGQKNGELRPSKFVQSFDWTDGCIALTNEEMDELLSLVKVGTPIEILP